MDNFVLFICGITITLISGMGVLVYMVSVGYQQALTGKSQENAAKFSQEKTGEGNAL